MFPILMCPRLAVQLAVSSLSHGHPRGLSRAFLPQQPSLAMGQSCNEAVIGRLW